MLHCHQMKKGQIYMCGDCGLEIQVVAECDSCTSPDGECEHEECSFVCCDKELVLKK